MTLLDSDTSVDDTRPIVATERLLWAGPLTVLTSVGAVLLVRLVAIQIPGVRSDAPPLGLIAPTVDTVILVSIAVVVFVQFTAADRTSRVHAQGQCIARQTAAVDPIRS